MNIKSFSLSHFSDYGGEGPEQRRVYDGATLRPNGHHANFFIAHTNAVSIVPQLSRLLGLLTTIKCC